MDFDVIIVGCGIAGCTAALHFAKQGQSVVLVTDRLDAMTSNSAWAQGGIVYQGEDDVSLVDDMLAASGSACDADAVRELAKVGPECVKRFLLEELKVPFDKGFTKEAAHSCSRILFARDETGAVIMRSLFAAIEEKKIPVVVEKKAVGLFIEGGICRGVHFAGETWRAKKTVFATGGIGDLYQYTSNSGGARGEGLGIAAKAGVAMKDLHYVQFHPTSFYAGGRCFLLSEAMRGEGGRLVDADYHPFMERVHPEADLAPRDIVSRAVYAQMKLGGVFLDVTHLGKTYLEERFPKIVAHCRKHGVDPAVQPIPAVPCSHYHCGGIAAKLDGTTSLPGFYAIGEVACTGVHGANRLASTSLLEGLVMGTLCGVSLEKFPLYKGDVLSRAAENGENLGAIRKIMWEHVGIVRTREGLKRGVQKLEGFVGNSAMAAQSIAKAALERPASCGAHYISIDQ